MWIKQGREETNDNGLLCDQHTHRYKFVAIEKKSVFTAISSKQPIKEIPLVQIVNADPNEENRSAFMYSGLADHRWLGFRD